MQPQRKQDVSSSHRANNTTNRAEARNHVAAIADNRCHFAWRSVVLLSGCSADPCGTHSRKGSDREERQDGD